MLDVHNEAELDAWLLSRRQLFNIVEKEVKKYTDVKNRSKIKSEPIVRPIVDSDRESFGSDYERESSSPEEVDFVKIRKST